MSNLPDWNGAAAVYSKAYAVLTRMSKTQVTLSKLGRKTVATPSDDMNDLVQALNSGDEERIKGLLLVGLDRCW